MHAADAMVAAVPEVRAADLAIRSDIKNQEVSAASKLAEQSRSLGGKEFGRATRESWQQDLAVQSRSLGGKEFGRAIKESSDHEKSLRTTKRVHRTIKVESPSDYKS